MNDYFITDFMVGSVFCYNGGLFVVCEFDYDERVYPNICIASRNSKYNVGMCYNFDSDTIAESTVSSTHLKSCFIPKDIDYEDE